MSIFNKAGKEFTELVTIPPQPGQPTTYTHKFPVKVGNTVEERWSTKVRPIRDLTNILRGCQLKRNQDYMVNFNGKEYEYWFENSKHALMFQIAASTLKQTVSPKGDKFDIECPHCQKVFATDQITWR